MLDLARQIPAWGKLLELLDHEIQEAINRDPDPLPEATLRRTMAAFDAFSPYFRPEIRGLEKVPRHGEGPALLVGNHSGLYYHPDLWILSSALHKHRGIGNPVNVLVYNLVFILPIANTLYKGMGGVPANARNANHVFDQQGAILVYPGGDMEAARPFRERKKVDLAGRSGFIKLAIQRKVPIFPVVAHGAHHSTLIVSRGERLAKAMGIDRLRVKVFPISLSLPWGLAPAFLPHIPLPGKVLIDIGDPMPWSHYSAEDAEDEGLIQSLYNEMIATMQRKLDALVEECPHPWLA